MPRSYADGGGSDARTARIGRSGGILRVTKQDAAGLDAAEQRTRAVVELLEDSAPEAHDRPGVRIGHRAFERAIRQREGEREPIERLIVDAIIRAEGEQIAEISTEVSAHKS